MEKMLCMLEELQNIKRAGDQKLQETEDEALALNWKVETLERNMKEMYSSLLSHEKQCGHNSITSPNVAASSRQLFPSAELTENFIDETEKLQERPFLVSTRSQLWITFSVFWTSTYTFSPILSDCFFSSV